MPPQTDQPSPAGDKSSAPKFDFTPPLEQRQEFTESTKTDQPTRQNIQDNNLVVPPLFTNVQIDGTIGGTGTNFLNMTSPYDSWGLEVTKRRWTDIAQTISPAHADKQSTVGTSADAARPVVADTSRGAITRSEVEGNVRPIVADASRGEITRTEVDSVGRDAVEKQPPSHGRLSAADVHNQKILDASKNAVGEKVWKGSQFERATVKGKFGGAASVSVLLQNQGYDYAKSASVSQLTKSMIANGWQLVGQNDAKPGDIIFGGKTGTNWRDGGGNGRIGIVGEEGKVYNNDSKTGKWTLSDKQQVFGKEFGDQVWILRPPAEGPQGRPIEREPASPDTTVERRHGRRRGHEQPQQREREDNPSSRDYRDFRGRQNWQGRDDGRYPPQYDRSNDINLSDFNPIEILKNAVDGIGKALWALTPFKHSVNNGRLGCAASVSEVLQRSGYRYANHAGVGGLESQLMQNGWRKAPLSSAQPGDVVMVGRSRGWRAGGGAAHVGIVGENGRVYHNNSARGKWVEDNLHARFGRGMERFVLKPPSNGSHKIDPRSFASRNPEPEVNPAPRQADRRHERGDRREDRREHRGYEPRGYGRDRGYDPREFQARYQPEDQRDNDEDGGSNRGRRTRRMREREERNQEEDATERRSRRHRRSRRY